MEPTDPTERMEYWKEHVQKMALFEGTQAEYARQNGLSAAKLSYYKGMFNPKKPSFAKIITDTVRETAPSAARTTVEDLPSKTKLPDAKWLAAFLKEFMR
jgi:hypothetical protein